METFQSVIEWEEALEAEGMLSYFSHLFIFLETSWSGREQHKHLSTSTTSAMVACHSQAPGLLGDSNIRAPNDELNCLAKILYNLQEQNN